MITKEGIKKRGSTNAKRLEAFGRTLQQGVSQQYLRYLKQEMKENRMVEKFL